AICTMLSTASLSMMAKKAPPNKVITAYGVFLTAALAVYHFIANGEFSAILTLAVIFQCLGFALLCVQVLLTGTCTGISARALALDAWALCFRLSSTLWLHGYLPVDASGDWAYQAVDVVSLVLVLWLLHSLFFEKKHSYQEEQDTFPATPVVLACLVLAAIFHADMNARPVFDTLWMAGLFISAVAVLPQLWLISKTGGKVEPLTSHYIAAMAISRALS
ncbi:kdelr1, partial [Symbiodinium sp. KB8]